MIENRVKIKYIILILFDFDLLLYMKYNVKLGKLFYGVILKYFWVESWVFKVGVCVGNMDLVVCIVFLKENVVK